MSERKAFHITGGKGFHMRLPNGYTVSVQFGPGNYCDHYNSRIGRDERECGEDGSDMAEVAVFPLGGGLIELPSEGEYKDTVAGYCTPEQVWKLMQWAAALPAVEANPVPVQDSPEAR